LYVVHPDGKAETIHSVPAYAKVFKETEIAFVKQTGKSAQGNHIWHPGFVQQLAKNLKIELDEVALEALIAAGF
jgi:hypothetical protein